VSVFGAGSWGTTFSQVLRDAGCEVRLWCRREELARIITATRINPDYLPELILPSNIRATHDPFEAADGAAVVVLAVPAQALRANLTEWKAALPPRAVIVSLIKGIELGTSKRMSEVISDVTGLASDQIAVLSGPNLAREIASRQPTASVIACAETSVAEHLQIAFQTAYFRPYTNGDVVGTELGGAVKNVIAVAVGMTAGLGFGDNTRASVMTRGLAETARLGAALGADPYTFQGLAGLGDLITTCSSPLSRNRTYGERLGAGESAASITATSRQVAEGAKSCDSILDLAARNGVEMPIVESVTRVVRGDVTPSEVARVLTSRPAKVERVML
jgi:glycerol-3-phosphate dehydrogenase (NAD(P)+)